MSHRPRLFKRIAMTLNTALLLGFCGSSLATDLVSVAARAVDDERVLTYSGTVESIQQTVLAIEVAGRVTELLVRPGERVQRGQVLLRVDARTAQDQALVQNAEVDAAKATLAVAESEFGRQRQLFSEGAISSAALERAEAEYQHSKASANARLAAASAARTTARQHVLVAPYEGRVSEVVARLGTLASPSVPLIKMYDPSALRVTLAIPEADIRMVEGAKPENITLSMAGVDGLSPVETILVPELDPLGHVAEMQLYLPRDVAVLPGAYTKAQFRVASPRAQMSIRVPRSSVVRRADVHVVYVTTDDAVGMRLVRVGRVIGDELEILSGLDAGERVLVAPDARAASL